jgi:FkbM family methyltransferase
MRDGLLRSIRFRAASAVGRLVSADMVASLSKFIFLRELLGTLRIDEILDVGANTGQFATSMRYLGYYGNIMSFEPIPEVFATLSETMGGDAKWIGYNMALGETDEVRDFNVMMSTVYSSFNRPIDIEGGSNRVVRTVPVKVCRLDSFLGTRDLGRTLLKVDTQGHDMPVLRGLGSMLDSVRAIQTEVSVNPLYEGIPHMDEVVEFLRHKSFKPAFFSPVGGRMRDLSAREFEYICVRP